MKRIVAFLAIVALLAQLFPATVLAAANEGGTTVVTSVLQEDDPAISYSGWWVPDEDAKYSGGRVNFTKDSQASLEFTFTGSGFRYIGIKTKNNEKLYVYIDDQLAGEVKPDANKAAYQQIMYEVNNLTYGTHKAEIRLRKKGEERVGGFPWQASPKVPSSISESVYGLFDNSQLEWPVLFSMNVDSIQILSALPSIPAAPKADYNADEVTVKWALVPNAMGYKVYRSTKPKGAAEFISAPVMGQTEFIDPLDGVSRDKDIHFYYTIAALGPDGNETAKSKETSVKVPKYNVPAPTGLTASVNQQIAALQWNTVPGASEYKVYRAPSGSPTYELIGSVRQNNFKDISLALQPFNSDTIFQYAVAAVRGGKDSGKSIPVQVLFPKNTAEAPGMLEAALIGDMIELQWVPVQGAVKYRIYRSMRDHDSLDLYGEITGASFSDPVDRRIDTTYYYAVSAVYQNDKESSTSPSISVFVAAQIPLEVIQAIPSNGETDVSRATKVNIAFNSPIREGSSFNEIRMLEAGTGLPISVAASVYGNSLQIAPTSLLKNNTGYMVVVPSQSIGKLDSEELLPEEYIVQFFTSRSTAFGIEMDNFLRNPGFDRYTGINGTADEWSKSITSGAKEDIQVIESPTNRSQLVQKVSASNLPNGGIAFVSQKIDIFSGRIFQAGAKVLVEGLSNAKMQVYVDFYDSTNKLITVAFTDLTAATNGYVDVQLNGITPKTAVAAKIHYILRSTGNGGEGTFYVDEGYFKYNTNHLVNSDFEKYNEAAGIADGWTKHVPSGIIGQFEHSDKAFNGQKSQYMASSGMPAGSAIMLSQKIPVESGKLFAFRGSILAEQLENAKVQLYVDFYNEANQLIEAKTQDFIAASVGFVPIQLISLTPVTAATARVYVVLRGTNTGGKGAVYVDQLEFTHRVSPITNSGFELYSGSNGIADGWTKNATAGITDRYQLVPSPAGTGAAQQISGSGLTSGSSIMLSQRVPVEPNKLFSMGANIQINTLNAASVQLYADFYNSANQIVGTKLMTHTSETNGFIPLQLSGVTPETAQTARVFIIVRGLGSNGSADLIVDDVYFSHYRTPLINSGFEVNTGSIGIADGWNTIVTSGSNGGFALVNAPTATGKTAQKITASGLPSGGYALISQKINIQPNRQFQVSGVIYAESLNQAIVQLYVDFYDGSNAIIGATTVDLRTATEGYVKLSKQITTAANAEYARVYVILRGVAPDASGVIYVDEVTFQ
jgi:hypothetical protein